MRHASSAASGRATSTSGAPTRGRARPSCASGCSTSPPAARSTSRRSAGRRVIALLDAGVVTDEGDLFALSRRRRRRRCRCSRALRRRPSSPTRRACRPRHRGRRVLSAIGSKLVENLENAKQPAAVAGAGGAVDPPCRPDGRAGAGAALRLDGPHPRPRPRGARRASRASARRSPRPCPSGSRSTGTPTIVDKWREAGVRMADERDASVPRDARGAVDRRDRLARRLQPRRGQGGDPAARRQGVGQRVEEDGLRGRRRLAGQQGTTRPSSWASPSSTSRVSATCWSTDPDGLAASPGADSSPGPSRR